MRDDVAIASFAARKCAHEFENAAEVEQEQGQNGAGLDDDRVHLPVSVVEVDLHQRFGDAQVRGGTDRKKFGEPLNNAQNGGKDVDVQKASGIAHGAKFAGLK